MALLQSLRQGGAPPETGLAAAEPPPASAAAGKTAGASRTSKAADAAGVGSGPAAAGAGAALLQQLQGMSVAQRPVPTASDVAAATEPAPTASTSELEVRSCAPAYLSGFPVPLHWFLTNNAKCACNVAVQKRSSS